MTVGPLPPRIWSWSPPPSCVQDAAHRHSVLIEISFAGLPASARWHLLPDVVCLSMGSSATPSPSGSSAGSFTLLLLFPARAIASLPLSSTLCVCQNASPIHQNSSLMQNCLLLPSCAQSTSSGSSKLLPCQRLHTASSPHRAHVGCSSDPSKIPATLSSCGSFLKAYLPPTIACHLPPSAAVAAPLPPFSGGRTSATYDAMQSPPGSNLCTSENLRHLAPSLEVSPSPATSYDPSSFP